MVDRAGAAVVVATIAPAVFPAVDPWGWYPFGPLRWLVVSTAVPAVAQRLFVGTPAGWTRGVLASPAAR